MGHFRQIDHTADVALKVSAENREDLLVTAAMGWRDLVLDENEISGGQERSIEVTAESIEELLVNFLSELNYLLIVKRWITARVIEIDLDEDSQQMKLFATLAGEPFDAEKHEIRTEIKAVTYHQMEVRQRGDRLGTTIVFDI
jgi:SHS2 domain-containing protein